VPIATFDGGFGIKRLNFLPIRTIDYRSIIVFEGIFLEEKMKGKGTKGRF